MKPLSWIGSLYFLQGLPSAIILQLAIVLLQHFGYSNSTITFLTGLFILPWSLKIFLSPLIMTYGRQNFWLISMQCLFVVILLLIAFTIKPQLHLFIFSLAFFGLAFCAAINDIITDGIYIARLSSAQQRFYIGLRTIFYHVGNFLCGGFALIGIAWASRYISILLAWRYLFVGLACLVIPLVFWHARVFKQKKLNTLSEKKSLALTLIAIKNDLMELPQCFLLLGLFFIYNFPGAIGMKIFPLFFLNQFASGGLGFSATQYSFINALGIGSMLLAVLISGWILNKWPLKNYLVFFNVLYALSFLAFMPFVHLESSFLHSCIAYMGNQFLFGLVNTGYMLLLVINARNCRQQPVIYAFFTTLMMLCFSLFGMSSGWLQSVLHYSGLFVLLCGATLFIVLYLFYLQKQDPYFAN